MNNFFLLFGMEWNKKTTLRETKKFLHVDFEQDKARDDQKGIKFLIIIVNSINNKTVIVELYRFFPIQHYKGKKCRVNIYSIQLVELSYMFGARS